MLRVRSAGEVAGFRLEGPQFVEVGVFVSTVTLSSANITTARQRASAGAEPFVEKVGGLNAKKGGTQGSWRVRQAHGEGKGLVSLRCMKAWEGGGDGSPSSSGEWHRPFSLATLSLIE